MEYPFKDLLPLDEVLEREGYYKDWTHLDPEVFYSLTQISEYIKTKGYGVDVRLLIAQLAEHFGLKTTQVVDLANLLQQKFENLEGVTQSFTNNINSLVAQMEADKDAVIANATVDSEVILARGGKATLGQRLDETTAQLAQTTSHLNDISINVKSLGAIGDGLSHPLNEFYTDLAQAQVDYPSATSLQDEIDYLAIQKAIDITDVNIYVPRGTYIINKPLFSDKNIQIKGAGEGADNVANHTVIRKVGHAEYNSVNAALYIDYERAIDISNIVISAEDYTGSTIVDNSIGVYFSGNLSRSNFNNLSISGFDVGFKTVGSVFLSQLSQVFITYCRHGMLIGNDNTENTSLMFDNVDFYKVVNPFRIGKVDYSVLNMVFDHCGKTAYDMVPEITNTTPILFRGRSVKGTTGNLGSENSNAMFMYITKECSAEFTILNYNQPSNLWSENENYTNVPIERQALFSVHGESNLTLKNFIIGHFSESGYVNQNSFLFSLGDLSKIKLENSYIYTDSYKFTKDSKNHLIVHASRILKTLDYNTATLKYLDNNIANLRVITGVITTTTAQDINVTFPNPYYHNCFYVGFVNSNFANEKNYGVANLTKNGFTLKKGDVPAGYDIRYIALGL